MDKSRLIAFSRSLGPAAARDAVGLAGIGSIVHGVAMFSAPAGWIVAGGLLVAAAVILGKRAA